MRIIRGFPGQDMVAGYTEAAGGGDIESFNAPRNAPARFPLQHLDKVAFHSRFYLYEVVFDQTVTIAHPAIAGGSAGKEGFWTGSIDQLSWEIFGRVSQTNHVLLSHGLGYVPLVMVAFNDAMIVAGTIVQVDTAGTRFVGVSADANNIYLADCGYSSDLTLPAVARNYRVLVFRTAAPNPSMPLFSGGPTQFQMGRDMVDSASKYLRRDSSLSPLDMDMGRTVDIENGGARVVTGGNIQTDQFYAGGFTGSPFIPVNV